MRWSNLISDVIHKFTRDQYQKRFPELESLVPTPMEYVRTVKVWNSEVFHFKHKSVFSSPELKAQGELL